MRRLVPFAVILGFYTYVACRIAAWAKYTFDVATFVVAIIVAGLTGATFFLANDWWDASQRPDRPQIVIHRTDDTPNQVVARGFAATVRLFCLVLLAVLILAYFVMGGPAYPP